MKRLLSLVLMLAMLCCLLIACTPASETNKNNTKATESTKPTQVPVDTLALQVGDHQINASVMNYFYMDAVTGFINQFSSYGDLASLYLQLYTGLDLTKPLSQQTYDPDTGKTWADYFIDDAVENAHWTYAVYDAALAANFVVPEDIQTELDSLPAALDTYAKYYGYANTDAYLQAVYGAYATAESYVEYYNISWISSAYAEQHYYGLAFSDDDLLAFEAGREAEYNSYNYSTYYISISKYLQMKYGKADQYSQEQTAQAIDDVRNIANTIASHTTSQDSLELAIVQANLDPSLFASSATKNEYLLYASIAIADVRDWLADDARIAGDTTVIEVTSTASVEGFYVVLFESKEENRAPFANVQHILLLAETAEEKETAKAKAQQILDGFLQSENPDSAAFGLLAKEHSEDSSSKDNGGLYENICRNNTYVDSFEDWALAGHQPGDTGIIETEYGIHIMYYKADGELTYRESMIDSDLRDETQYQWETQTMEATTLVVKDTSFLNKDLVLQQ